MAIGTTFGAQGVMQMVSGWGLSYRSALASLVALLLVLAAGTARADTPVKPDEGKFVILLQEAEIGTDTFTIKANGEAECRATVNLAGQKLELHNISTVSNGHAVSIFSEAPGHGKFQLTIQGEAGKLTVDDKP